MDISIVIPTYQESKKIVADIGAAGGFLKDNCLKAEIIVVDDGSEDDTAEIAKEVGAGLVGEIGLEVIHYDKHRGKGYAVRSGMKQTSGEYVMFADSGCCVPYTNVADGLKLLKSGACEIAHGSRKLSSSRINRKQSWYRRICSAVFHRFIIYFMKIPADFTDTQCGFKIYKGDVGRKLYAECMTDGFMFDVEIVMRALKQGYRIKEFAVNWTCDRDSRLSPTRSLWRILLELIAIRKAIRDDR